MAKSKEGNAIVFGIGIYPIGDDRWWVELMIYGGKEERGATGS